MFGLYVDELEDGIFVIKNDKGQIIVDREFTSEEEAEDFMIEMDWEKTWGDWI